jgi:hypothetical protein
MGAVRIARGRKLRVLTLDIENRPLSYLGQDFTTAEITAIAYRLWGDRKPPRAWVLGEDTLPTMLTMFRLRYDEADIVTGHNILRHDLRMLNGMLLEQRLPPLLPKLVCDTYKHLKQRTGVSASQEALAGMLGVKALKVGMSQKSWREANRLLPEGIAKTKARVVGDVLQHEQMRQRLLELDWLKPPKVWRP